MMQPYVGTAAGLWISLFHSIGDFGQA